MLSLPEGSGHGIDGADRRLHRVLVPQATFRLPLCKGVFLALPLSPQGSQTLLPAPWEFGPESSQAFTEGTGERE